MRRSAFAGLFVLCTIFVLQHTASASALTEENAPNQIKLNSSLVTSLQGMPFSGTAPMEALQKIEKESQQPAQAMPPEPKQHKVEDGETLASIAATNNTTWERLFYKNTDVTDPNVITPGQTLVIPAVDEQLTERPLPTPAPAQAPVAATSTPTQPRARGYAAVGSSAGNTYSPGYCTWYAKNRRPDLPNNLGNADTWVARAAAQGIATGTAPRAGAIGQQGMHVVYVESVNGDGTVTISEMNYNGWGAVDQRTVPASSFMYIY